jgi:hypothetical protein
MGGMHFVNIRPVLASIPIILFLFVGGIFGQSSRCEGFDKKVTYEILIDNVSIRDSRKISLRIYVKPGRFTVASMVRLFERINREYCQFDSITVGIFDTKKLEKLPDPPPHPLSEWQSKTPPRAFYQYDRRADAGELTFQEKRGSKEIDVEIVFRPDGYCVSEMTTPPSENK